MFFLVLPDRVRLEWGPLRVIAGRSASQARQAVTGRAQVPWAWGCGRAMTYPASRSPKDGST